MALSPQRKLHSGLSGQIKLAIYGLLSLALTNLAIPADLVQARFGQAFNIEAGKVVATDAAGNKVFSRRRPGEMAEFDEALEYLIEQYPHKDHILKASGHSGGGSQQTQPPLGQKTLKRSAFDALDSGSKQAALKDGMSIVD